MKFEFLQRRYDLELDRRDKLTNALSLPVGVLTGLGGLIALMVRSFSYEEMRLATVFLVLIALDLVAFFVCLIFLARAYHGEAYEYLPMLSELDAAEREWRAWVRAQPDATEESFSRRLRRSLIKAADHNTNLNDRRQGFFHTATIALFAVLVCTAAAGVPLLWDQTRHGHSHASTTDNKSAARSR